MIKEPILLKGRNGYLIKGKNIKNYGYQDKNAYSSMLFLQEIITAVVPTLCFKMWAEVDRYTKGKEVLGQVRTVPKYENAKN